MSECTVLIAPVDVLPALRDRVASDAELLAFADTEALRALDTIIARGPAVVSLEGGFAATSRGTALINRIKADPALAGSEVRIITSETVPVSTPSVPDAAAAGTPLPFDSSVPGRALDQSGTRRVPRYAMATGVDVLMDGKPSTLVNLSTTGAQVLSSAVLRPNQRVRMSIANDGTVLRAIGTIAWASFEMPPGGSPHYRAGVAFVTADTTALETFCLKYRAEEP